MKELMAACEPIGPTGPVSELFILRANLAAAQVKIDDAVAAMKLARAQCDICLPDDLCDPCETLRNALARLTSVGP